MTLFPATISLFSKCSMIFFFLRAVNEKLLNCQSLEPTWGLAPPGSVHPPRLLQPGSSHLQDGGDRVHSGCLTEQSNHVLEGSMQVVVYGQTEPSGLSPSRPAAPSPPVPKHRRRGSALLRGHRLGTGWAHGARVFLL